MGIFSSRAKIKEETRKSSLEQKYEKVKKEITPLLGKILLFGETPLVVVDIQLGEKNIKIKWKEAECLKGHCLINKLYFFFLTHGDDFDGARYNWIRFNDTIKKFKEEGYEKP